MEPLSYSVVFAQRLLCLGVVTTSMSPRLHFLFSQIPAAVFWPISRGAATLVIGLGTSIKDRIGQASGFDKFILFGPLLFAIAMAVFGADHLVTASFVAKIVPSWIPGRLFWAYFVGFALLTAALSLATTIKWRLATALLGIVIFLFVLTIHIPGLLAPPHDKIFLTLLLRDLTLSAGALALCRVAKPVQHERPSPVFNPSGRN